MNIWFVLPVVNFCKSIQKTQNPSCGPILVIVHGATVGDSEIPVMLFGLNSLSDFPTGLLSGSCASVS